MPAMEIQAMILSLLADSPVVSNKVLEDVTNLVYAGEEGLAFDTLCEWIYEDDLPITGAYFERLRVVATELHISESMRGLEELITEGEPEP